MYLALYWVENGVLWGQCYVVRFARLSYETLAVTRQPETTMRFEKMLFRMVVSGEKWKYTVCKPKTLSPFMSRKLSAVCHHLLHQIGTYLPNGATMPPAPTVSSMIDAGKWLESVKFSAAYTKVCGSLNPHTFPWGSRLCAAEASILLFSGSLPHIGLPPMFLSSLCVSKLRQPLIVEGEGGIEQCDNA